jgi:hypothetical protein
MGRQRDSIPAVRQDRCDDNEEKNAINRLEGDPENDPFENDKFN